MQNDQLSKHLINGFDCQMNITTFASQVIQDPTKPSRWSRPTWVRLQTKITQPTWTWSIPFTLRFSSSILMTLSSQLYLPCHLQFLYRVEYSYPKLKTSIHLTTGPNSTAHFQHIVQNQDKRTKMRAWNPLQPHRFTRSRWVTEIRKISTWVPKQGIEM